MDPIRVVDLEAGVKKKRGKGTMRCRREGEKNRINGEEVFIGRRVEKGGGTEARARHAFP